MIFQYGFKTSGLTSSLHNEKSCIAYNYRQLSTNTKIKNPPPRGLKKIISTLQYSILISAESCLWYDAINNYFIFQEALNIDFGLPDSNSARIINGIPSSPGSWQWQVSNIRWVDQNRLSSIRKKNYVQHRIVSRILISGLQKLVLIIHLISVESCL